MNSKRPRPQKNHLALLLIVALVSFAVATPSYAISRLILIEPNEHHGEDTQPYRGLKVCLVVKDSRNESVVKAQMCGVMRNSLHKPIYVTMLKNKESLESLLAYSISDSLEFAGYKVVKVYPSRPEALSSEGRNKPLGTKKDIKLAKKSQPKSARGDAEAFRELEALGEGVTFSKVPGSVAAQGEKGWTNGADAVLEITIEKFASDTVFHFWKIEAFAWSAVTLSVAPGESGHQEDLATTQAHGWGEIATNGAVNKRSYKRALDMSYRMLVNHVETVFLSDEFFTALQDASGADKKSQLQQLDNLDSNLSRQPHEALQTSAERNSATKLRAELEEKMKNSLP